MSRFPRLRAATLGLVAQALALLALSACGIVETAGGGTDDPNGLTARIAGTAVGPDSTPVQAIAILSRVVLAEGGNALVRIDSVRADAAGAFRFEQVAQGRYALETRSLDGRQAALLAHIDRVGRAEVRLGKVAMAPPATLQGRLDLPASLGQAATVSVSGIDRIAAIGADGSYRLDSVPSGEIDLVFRVGRLVNVLPLRLLAEPRTMPVSVAPVALRAASGGIAPPEAVAGLAATYVAPSAAPVSEGIGLTYLAAGIAGDKDAPPVFQPWSSGGSTRRLESGSLVAASGGQNLLVTRDTMLLLEGLSNFGSFRGGQILLLDVLQTAQGAQVIDVLQAPEIGIVLDSVSIVDGFVTTSASVESQKPPVVFAEVADFQARRAGRHEFVLGFRHDACADSIIPRFWRIGSAVAVAESDAGPLQEIGVGIELLHGAPCPQTASSGWSSIQVRIEDLPIAGFVLVSEPGGARIAIAAADSLPSGPLWDFEEPGGPPYIAAFPADTPSAGDATRIPTPSGQALVLTHPGATQPGPFRVGLSDPSGFAASPVPDSIALRARSSRPVKVRIVVESPDSAYRATRDAGGPYLGAIVEIQPSQDPVGKLPQAAFSLGVLNPLSPESAGPPLWAAERGNILRTMTGISLVVDDVAGADGLSIEIDDIRFLP